MIPFIADLPDIGYIIAACVVIALLGAIGLSVLLRGMQDLRAGIAKELKGEMDSAKEPSPISVQQPLIVKGHQEFVTRADLEKIDTQLHGRLKRERGELDERILRVENTAAERSDKLEEKLDDNTKLTAEMSGQVKQINQNVQLVLTALTTSANK